MDKKYPDLYALMKQDKQAKDYYDSLPGYVRDAISQRAGGVNSFESLCHYAENLTKDDD